MRANYQKLYAYLVGQVDEALQEIAGILINGEPGRNEIVALGEKLKNALLATEDMFLEDTEE